VKFTPLVVTGVIEFSQALFFFIQKSLAYELFLHFENLSLKLFLDFLPNFSLTILIKLFL